MRVVSWNIQKRSGSALGGVIAGLRNVEPDLLLLQACTRASLETLAPARTLGLPHLASAIEEAEAAGKYAASVIASRWPLVHMKGLWATAPVRTDPALAGYRKLYPQWNGDTPRPWMVTRATVKAPSGAIDVIDAHIQDGSKKSDDKLKSMVALGAALAQAPVGPRLFGGDLDLPRSEEKGRIVCFGRAKNRGPLWEQAGRTIVTELYNLRDVYRSFHGYEPERTADAYSFIAGTAQRRFDHLFASPDLRTRAVEYRIDWLKYKLSDHAPLIATLAWSSGAEA